MQLIKAQDGSYINADQVKSFYADKSGRVFANFGLIVRSDGAVVDWESRQLRQFDSEAAAQEWLNRFAAKFDSKSKTREIISDVFGTLTQLTKKA